MKRTYALVAVALVLPTLTLAQSTKPKPNSIDLQTQRQELANQNELRRAAAISLAQNSATEAPLWNDKRTAVMVLTDTADLLWDEPPGQGAKWLVKAWALIDQVTESPRNEQLKEFFNHSDKAYLRTLVLSVARKRDVELAETFLKQLSQQEPDEKKDRGAFDDKTARSEQLLSLAQRAIDANPELAFSLAENSLTDGISFSLQNVLTGLRARNVDLANRLFDLALARFASAEPDPSEAEVLAGYLFQSGFTFSANSAGQTILAVNPAQQKLPAVAPKEPLRARAFLIAVYQILIARPNSIATPEAKQRSQRILVLGQRLGESYNTFAPEFAQPAQGFLAQLRRQLLTDDEIAATDSGTRPSTTNENTTKSLTREEVYEKHLAGLEDKADKANNPIARKLAYVDAVLATRPDDYDRGQRIAQKIDDNDLRADAVSFVLYRAALFFLEKGNEKKALDIVPTIGDSSRRAVVQIAIAQRLMSSGSEKRDPAAVTFARERALELLNEIDREVKSSDPSSNAAKILMARTGILANLDLNQALASLDQTIQMINRLDHFDLRNAAAPNLGMGAFSASGATVVAPRIGFDFRSAIDPLIVANFEQVSALAERITAKELSGVARLEAAKLYLGKTRTAKLKEPIAAVR